MSEQPIVYWNREKGREEEELIYGERGLRWLYGTRAGRWFARRLVARPWVSRLVGLYQSSPLSRGRIPSFIAGYRIPMEEYEERRFRSFNDFFARRFREGARTFSPEPAELPAFAEGRYLAWEAAPRGEGLPLKGFRIPPEVLLGGSDRAAPFSRGPAVVARLCPTDYHRFHYPDAGRTRESVGIRGVLHSVNPIALQQDPRILVTNERRASILETENFGLLAYVEVGAMNVGRIVETHPVEAAFERGDEKGYFLFGASSIVLLGEPGRWRPDGDLLERTRGGQESFVRLGKRIAARG